MDVNSATPLPPDDWRRLVRRGGDHRRVSVALVLTGAPGTGKSSVLEALTTHLEIDRVEHSALETEELGRGWPALGVDGWLAQLAAVLDLQRRAGRRLFLLAATTETEAELRGVLAAADADRTLVVLLVAPPDAVAARIDAREPDRWPGKRALVAHARGLATSMPRDLTSVDVRLSTDGRRAEEVAREVRDHLAATLAS